MNTDVFSGCWFYYSRTFLCVFTINVVASGMGGTVMTYSGVHDPSV